MRSDLVHPPRKVAGVPEGKFSILWKKFKKVFHTVEKLGEMAVSNIPVFPHSNIPSSACVARGPGFWPGVCPLKWDSGRCNGMSFGLEGTVVENGGAGNPEVMNIHAEIAKIDVSGHKPRRIPSAKWRS